MTPPAVTKRLALGSALRTLCSFALALAWAPLVRADERPPIPPPAERVRTVDTKLEIRLYEKVAQLWLWETNSVAVAVARIPEQIAVFRALSPEKIYRVTLWEEIAAEYGTGEEKTQLWETRILKVEEGAELLYDASQCEVHKTTMRKELVPVAYGLTAETDYELRATKFPHAKHSAPGGCLQRDKTHRYLFLCAECEKAEQEHARQALP